MIVVRDTETVQESGLAATLGFFDGVHAGHRFLIRELRETARARRLPSAVITFPRHPREVLQAAFRPQLLNTFDEKIALLSETGIDYCIVMDFTSALAQLSAQDFLRTVLADRLHVRALLVGHDHRFGHNRTDDVEQYKAFGRCCNLNVLETAAFTAMPDADAVSSSGIRHLLAQGQVADAATLLTYPYTLSGRVVHGHHIGRTLGFPTANILPADPTKLIPATGAYAVTATLDNDPTPHPAMLHIGRRPTLNNDPNAPLSLEAHLLNYNADLYDHTLTLTFRHYLRDNRRFPTPSDLAAQLADDRQATLRYFADRPTD